LQSFFDLRQWNDHVISAVNHPNVRC
jgi:hypothetical protein